MTEPLALAKSRHRDRRYLTGQRLLGLLSLVATALGWYFLAPAAVGGTASYVVTSGTSMLPTITGNGLVITRSHTSYHIGEIVAYHNRELRQVVLHRIVGRDGARYIFKGDNNGFTDPYHPTAADIVGAKWLYWQSGGRLLLNLRTPWVGALLLGGMGMFAMTGGGNNQSSRHRRRRRNRRTK